MSALPDEARLRDAAAAAVEAATRLGADAASATVHAGAGLRISVVNGQVENASRHGNQSLSLTVYRGGRRGTATTAAIDAASIRLVSDEAFAIAGAVQPDDDAGLADPQLLAIDTPLPALADPRDLDAGALLNRALELEALTAGRPVPAGSSVRITEIGTTASNGAMALATSAGFCRSAPSSFYGHWAVVMASDGAGSVTDAANAVDRRLDALDSTAVIAARAVDRAVSALGARTLPSRRSPVILDARIAGSLVQDLLAGLNGGAQYRRATWLHDSIGQQVAAGHLDLNEDPFEAYGLASGAFDSEGVAGNARAILSEGVVRGYLLDTLSARRLGMASTGNASGAWNLTLSSRNGTDDTPALRQRLGTGFLVTQLRGGATNPTTGNWTRSAGGFWIENGEIVHAVTDVTLGGNFRDMLKGVVALGSDVERNGAIRAGSVLIDEMQIGGAA